MVKPADMSVATDPVSEGPTIEMTNNGCLMFALIIIAAVAAVCVYNCVDRYFDYKEHLNDSGQSGQYFGS